MTNTIRLTEFLKFLRSKLGPIIRNNLIWDAKTGNTVPQPADNGEGGSVVVQAEHLRPFTVGVHYYEPHPVQEGPGEINVETLPWFLRKFPGM
jgi:hypothetical protein